MSKFTSLFFCALITVLLFITIFGNHGLLQRHYLSLELRDLEKKNRQIQSEIVRLRNQMYALDHSDFTLEVEAREQLGLSKPGEIVYILPQTRTAQDE